MKLLLSLFTFSILNYSVAADINCNATGMWRSGSKQLMIDCDGVKGDIANSVVAKAVTVKVLRPVLADGKPVFENGVQKYESKNYSFTGALKSPAYMYYANPKHPDILAELAKTPGALQRGDKLEFDSVLLDDSTTLYGNDDVVIGTIAEVKAKVDEANSKVTCEFGLIGADGKVDPSTKLSLVSAEFCTGKKICVGKATCTQKGVKTTKVLGCAAVGDECPDATSCYDDQKVIVSTLK